MSAVRMIDVKSSNVTKIGRAGDELHVTFKSGEEYVYKGVPVALFHMLLAADSVGVALGKNIKGKFAHVKRDPHSRLQHAKPHHS